MCTCRTADSTDEFDAWITGHLSSLHAIKLIALLMLHPKKTGKLASIKCAPMHTICWRSACCKAGLVENAWLWAMWDYLSGGATSNVSLQIGSCVLSLAGIQALKLCTEAQTSQRAVEA